MNTDNAAFRERFWPAQEAASRALVAELARSARFEPTEADMLEVIAEAGEAWGKEEEKRAVAAQAALSAIPASINDQAPPAKKRAPRARDLEKEGRVGRGSNYWAERVSNFIAAAPNAPRTTPPQIMTALQATLYLMENGCTSSEHLGRVLGRNRRYAGVLLSRARSIKGQ